MSAETNIKIHLAVGALLACACWALSEFAGLKIPSEIAMAAGTVVETCLMFALPKDALDRRPSP